MPEDREFPIVSPPKDEKRLERVSRITRVLDYIKSHPQNTAGEIKNSASSTNNLVSVERNNALSAQKPVNVNKEERAAQSYEEGQNIDQKSPQKLVDLKV